MSGLKKIKDGILRQASKKADEILKEAEQKCAQILKEGEERQAEHKARLDVSSDKECEDIRDRARSNANRERRQALLALRGQMIDEVILSAREKIINLPKEEYFDFLLGLFKENALPRDGVIRFAEADYDVLPKDFLGALAAVFPDNTLKLSDAPTQMERGFTIEYGDILQNCSIEGVFESERQRLRDAAYRILTDA